MMEQQSEYTQMAFVSQNYDYQEITTENFFIGARGYSGTASAL